VFPCGCKLTKGFEMLFGFFNVRFHNLNIAQTYNGSKFFMSFFIALSCICYNFSCPSYIS
jgi:hypothetical protein